MSGQTDLKLCQEKIGYHFRKIKYLTIALTHSSYANEGKKEDPCNERQEFLGDAVLSIIVSDYLFRHYSHLPEGELTKLRAALVCEKALCRYALSLGLGDFLLLGNRFSGAISGQCAASAFPGGKRRNRRKGRTKRRSRDRLSSVRHPRGMSPGAAS